MAVPITGFKITDIQAELGESGQTDAESLMLSENVVAAGLDPAYCSGLADLRAIPYNIGKFRGYEKPATVNNLYGVLYNSFVATSLTKNIAPIDPNLSTAQNWRVPNDTDIFLLQIASSSLNNKLKLDKILVGDPPTNHPGWKSPNLHAENLFEFRGLGTGSRVHTYPPSFQEAPNPYTDATFEKLGEALVLLTSIKSTYTGHDGNTYQAVWVFDMRYNTAGRYYKSVTTFGYSIRCCRNYIEGYDVAPYPPVYDSQGNRYDVIKINDRMWLQSDMRATAYNDGSSIPIRQTNADWLANTSMHACCVNEF